MKTWRDSTARVTSSQVPLTTERHTPTSYRHNATKGATIDGKTVDVKTADGCTIDGKTVDGEEVDDRPSSASANTRNA